MNENIVAIENRQRKVALDPSLKEQMKACVDACLALQEFPCAAQLCIRLVSDQVIRRYNLEYMGKDRPTDVLSFPMLEYDANMRPLIDPADYLPGQSATVVLGDMMISVERAVAQASEYGHSFARELCYLTVHSMFHLLGFDHMNEADKQIMRQKEEQVLSQLGMLRE